MKKKARNIELNLEKREGGKSAKESYALRSLRATLGLSQSGAKSVYSRPKSSNVTPGERVKTFAVVALSIVTMFVGMAILITLIRLGLGGILG